jgi:ferredoxin
MRRKIVRIDEEKCDGCGQCVPACAEGAIALVGGKAKLAADVLCDGLGACLGECPRGAITVEEREAEAFDETAVHAHLAAQRASPPVRPAGRPKLTVVSDAGPAPGGGCPGAAPRSLPRRPLAAVPAATGPISPATGESRLSHWPVQLHLVPPHAPWLRGADLLVAADCVPFAYARFHDELLAGRAVVVGCPKLDDLRAYVDKLAAIFVAAGVKSVTVARMEVPCCGGIAAATQQALQTVGADVPYRDVVVGVDGTLRS